MVVVLGFITSTIQLPTEWHHACVWTPVERDGVAGFAQFCTYFRRIFGVHAVRIFFKCHIKRHAYFNSHTSACLRTTFSMLCASRQLNSTQQRTTDAGV